MSSSSVIRGKQIKRAMRYLFYIHENNTLHLANASIGEDV